MSELLSIKPQLIEERVLKQMYDDIAGMYNILTNKPDISLAARLPEVGRIGLPGIAYTSAGRDGCWPSS